MRPIRLLILLLAVALALGLALMRPLQGRATGQAGKWPAVHPAPRLEPLRRQLTFFHHREAERMFGRRVVSYARHFLGIPYRWGGSSPRSGFDCSGLVRFVYGHFGISLPHSSWADLAHGRHVTRRHLRPGDVVFLYGAGHVGIYVGGGRFIDAPHSGARVQVSRMPGYPAYYSARRFEAR